MRRSPPHSSPLLKPPHTSTTPRSWTPLLLILCLMPAQLTAHNINQTFEDANWNAQDTFKDNIRNNTRDSDVKRTNGNLEADSQKLNLNYINEDIMDSNEMYLVARSNETSFEGNYGNESEDGIVTVILNKDINKSIIINDSVIEGDTNSSRLKESRKNEEDLLRNSKIHDIDETDIDEYYTNQSTNEFSEETTYERNILNHDEIQHNITDVRSIDKEYQSLINGVKRKLQINDTVHEKELEYHDKPIDQINFTSLLETTATAITKSKPVNENLKTTKYIKENTTMEKLIDDATRAKIFHDFFKTISKNKVNYFTTEGNLEEQNENEAENILKYNVNYTNDSKDINESLRNENRSQVASFTRLQTPKPDFVHEVTRSTSPRIISILGLFELSVGSRPRADGLSELTAARLAVEHVNRHGLLAGYRVELLVNDTKCDPGAGVDGLFHALYASPARMMALLGTACSDVTESIAKVVPYWNIVQVSFGATSPALSDRSEFPLFCRTVAPDSSHNPARIAFIRQFGWDTVTAFTQNEEIYSLAVNELVTQLELANITCAASITFAETDFKQQLLQLKELDTRIIIGSFSQEMIPKIFCEAFRLGMWGAEYAWLIAGDPPRTQDSTSCSRAELATALEGLVTVTAHRGIVGEKTSYSGLTNEMFHQQMEEAGAPVSTFAPQTYDAVWAISLALSRAEQYWRTLETGNQTAKRMGLSYFDYDRKDMAEEFLNQVANMSFLGVSGPVSFNGADRIGTSAFYQIQGGYPKAVALYTHGTKMPCPECSTPQWAGGVPAARRVLVLRVDSVWAPARLAVAALAMAGVALALTFLVLNLHYSKRRSIKLSSPRLNNMTLIGCALVYTAVALLGVDNATLPAYVPFSALCTGRVYILSAGFSLAFGSMFAKTYRVHRIFISNRSGVCKTKLLQDTPLISLVCALLVIDGLIVTLWAALDPMERHLKNLTVEISTTDRSVVYQPQVEVCESQNTTGWLCALYAYKGLLLIVGVYMAWETRHVKISALNDSKYIGISVYSVVITSTSVVVIGTMISERATIAYISITSLILITTTSTLCLLFLPKIIAIRTKTEEDPVTQSLGLRLECKTRRFVTDDTQELHFRIEIQNKVFRREVAALDKEIGRLERLLAEPLKRGSNASISLHRRTELNTVEEEIRRDERRTPSITGGLPMLLLSVLPPVIPRASWPSAESCRRNSVNFSSQPKLNRRSQPSVDLYSFCLNRRDENPGLLKRLKSFFGSRPSSRKSSTMSIADPSGQSIAAALKMHVGVIAGLVPGNRKHSIGRSFNTLNVPHSELKLRRESFARSGPIIRVNDDEPSCSHDYDRMISSSRQLLGDRRKSSGHKYVAEPETKVNFVLPMTHKTRSSSNDSSSTEKIKGSPRFPHRITPKGSLTTLDKRKTSADSVFSISGKIFDEQRRFSHQNVNREHCEVVLESRWRSAEDSMPGPSGQ